MASIPHDSTAFTQGLLLVGQQLYEGTALRGQSEVRRVDRRSGAVRIRMPVRDSLFGEGIAVLGDQLFQLSWLGGRGTVYDSKTLAPKDSFTYAGEGWGLTTDSTQLYLSDFTDQIRVIDPTTFTVVRTFKVAEAGRPVWMLNELEWMHGELLANVYQTDLIARIDPATGQVVGWFDVSALLTAAERASVASRGGVANGIAYDARSRRVLVTGKLWPRLFEIEIADR